MLYYFIMASEETASYQVRIKGRVQGVWFRDWTRGEAVRREVSGWVRNCTDGSVEAVISGSPNRVQEMIKAFETGPPAARVVSVQAEPCGPPNHAGFKRLG